LLVAGTIGLIASAAYLLLSKASKERRKQAVELTQQLAQIQDRLTKQANAITAGYRKLKSDFETAVEEFNVECEHYRTDKAKLEDVLVYQRVSQKNQFLAQHLVQDSFAQTHGLGTSMVSMLQSFGVDSALDVNKLNLSAIPLMSPALKLELMQWREKIEATFVHKPEHGVTFSDAKSANEAAVRRFKATQARRVLMGGKQLQAMVDVANYELQRAMGEFDNLVTRGREAAVKLRDFQSGQRMLERLLNQSPVSILGPAIGAPILGLILYLVFG
jgi:DNA-binding helix-hairpin-helix protein with protein kinase domain